MTICDLCKKNVPTKVCAFGKIINACQCLPTWDLCDECEKRILDKINESIAEAK